MMATLVSMYAIENFTTISLCCCSFIFLVKLNINRNISRNQLPIPYIFGAMLKKDQIYEMESLHFHWGAKNNRGSEHTFNNVR